MNTVKIELDEDTAKQYELFCKHLEFFKILEQARVFEVQHGNVIINFKETPGQIMSIKGDLPLYFRKPI